jgi:beta-xylosidase
MPKALIALVIVLSTSAAGWTKNPMLHGWYADPEAIVYDDRYWIFPTYSDEVGESKPIDEAKLTPRQRQTINKHYLKHSRFDAFSSPDLVNWTKHPNVLTIDDISWGEYALWAPSAIRQNGKYYLLFGLNDIQNKNELGGIGVAVADKPEGPYRDAIGKPLVDEFHNWAQPIDPFVFRDGDGQLYLYYGGWKHCNVAKLRPDMTGFEPFDDGTTFKEVTPENYVEGPFAFRRNGKLYFMWSEGGWTGPDYSVAYAIADSPLGPFKRMGKILQQDPDVATGAGHHSVIPAPGSDTWWIVYHRRPKGDDNAHHREVCIDRMEFNPDGTIKPVKITFEGVGRQPL